MISTTARGALRRLSAVVAATVPATVPATVVAVALLGSLSGCFPLQPDPQPTTTGLAEPGSVAPLAPLVVPAVLNHCPLESAVHYSGYWLPIDEVYICRADGKHDTDGVSSYGPWESASQIENPAKLLGAYRVADAPKSRGLCTLFRSDPLIIWEHRDGVTSAYYAPVDSCGNPTDAATTAYQSAKRTLLIDVDRGAPDSSKKDATG
jgi:hypothetical protein